MNLIGHFACTPTPAAPVRLGSVLPDLLGLYRRPVRAHALLKLWAGETERLPGSDGLMAGMRFHHTVDAHFHRAPLFVELAGAIAAALRQASDAPGLRRFLPAHVLSELYLDHLLLRRRPALERAFYETLTEGRSLLTAFVARHPRADGASFGAFLARIERERFVADYHTHAGLFSRMNRILARYAQRPLLAPETEALERLFVRRAGATRAALDGFLAEMAPRLGSDAAPRDAGPAAEDATRRAAARRKEPRLAVQPG
jgi:hypothetical protein